MIRPYVPPLSEGIHPLLFGLIFPDNFRKEDIENVINVINKRFPPTANMIARKLYRWENQALSQIPN